MSVFHDKLAVCKDMYYWNWEPCHARRRIRSYGGEVRIADGECAIIHSSFFPGSRRRILIFTWALACREIPKRQHWVWQCAYWPAFSAKKDLPGILYADFYGRLGSRMPCIVCVLYWTDALFPMSLFVCLCVDGNIAVGGASRRI